MRLEKSKANKGVRDFFQFVEKKNQPSYISVVTLGELRRGVELIRHRGDLQQATQLERWLDLIVNEYKDRVLTFSETEAQVWGALRVPRHENAIDK